MAPQMTDWLPIESAPRDGTPILATNGNYLYALQRCVVVFWDDDEDEKEGWHTPFDAVGAEPFLFLTHWQPLPKPPSEQKGEK